MRTIKTIEVDRWSAPDEQSRVRHIGMAKTQDVFDKLVEHLKANDLLPDEYFITAMSLPDELPNYVSAVCHTAYGESEGIYMDISLIYYDSSQKKHALDFATGKTLGETADDFFRMSRIAAECSLMLNGRGITYQQTNTEFVLTPEQADIVRNELDSPLEAESPGLATTCETDVDEKVFTMACSGDIKGLESYCSEGGSLDVTYHKFGQDHSLIMGAYRNKEWDTVNWLLDHGAKVTPTEQQEMDEFAEQIGMLRLIRQHGQTESSSSTPAEESDEPSLSM